MLITTYVSPSSREMADELSKVLGSRTIQSGSITRGKGRTQNLQMMGQRLLSEDQIIQLQQGDFIIMKAGTRPVQTQLPMYWDYIPDYEDCDGKVENENVTIVCLTADKMRLLAQRKKYKLTRGMFS